jgi:hypothetical protein
MDNKKIVKRVVNSFEECLQCLEVSVWSNYWNVLFIWLSAFFRRRFLFFSFRSRWFSTPSYLQNRLTSEKENILEFMFTRNIIHNICLIFIVHSINLVIFVILILVIRGNSQNYENQNVENQKELRK